MTILLASAPSHRLTSAHVAAAVHAPDVGLSVQHEVLAAPLGRQLLWGEVVSATWFVLIICELYNSTVNDAIEGIKLIDKK